MQNKTQQDCTMMLTNYWSQWTMQSCEKAATKFRIQQCGSNYYIIVMTLSLDWWTPSWSTSFCTSKLWPFSIWLKCGLVNLSTWARTLHPVYSYFLLAGLQNLLANTYFIHTILLQTPHLLHWTSQEMCRLPTKKKYRGVILRFCAIFMAHAISFPIQWVKVMICEYIGS